MATIYQVSELAGVSLATVSRVMNNNVKVSDKTKQKVLAAMKTLDYRPNTIAQSLASNRSNSIGVLVSALDGAFFGSMMRGIDEELRKAGKHAIITAGHSSEQVEKEGIEFLISRKCDALILHSEALSDEFLIDLSKGSVPIVLINRYIAEIAENCLYLDNEVGGYIATKTVLEKGHRNIAYISGPMWKADAIGRMNGHKKALAEYGVKFTNALSYEGDYLEQSGIDAINALLQNNQTFTAVVCANDMMASGAIDALREHGFRVPKGVSVMGFDNISFSRYLFPKLSTVNYPVLEMGEMAAKWVLKNVYQHKKLALTNIFTPELVLRNSVIENN
jgi:LacI family transcriptional regulator